MNKVANSTLYYHLMHPGGESEPGDPNAAFYLDGSYHLHYILAHSWKEGRSFSFVHVISDDMLHWEWQAMKLQPSFTGHGMFSGTGFITDDGLPAVIYHGQGSSQNQIAIAKDRQISAWEQPYPVVVHTSEGVEADIDRHWDPDCFKVGEDWYAISGGVEQPLFTSKDLKHWVYVGDFLSHELPDTMIGEDISCPNFFPLGDKWVLLCISHSLGCRYYIGDWDNEKEQFVPETHGRMNWRREDQPIHGFDKRTDFFAPESVLTPDGRRVMWGWVLSAGPDKIVSGKTIQSLPRELSLTDDNRLRIKPLEELKSLRYNQVSLTNISLDHPVTNLGMIVPPSDESFRQKLFDIEGDALEIKIVISPKEAYRKLFGFILYGDNPDGGLPILFRPETGTLRVGNTEAPLSITDIPEDEDVELRIFIDRYLVEVFACNRQALVAVYPEFTSNQRLDGFSVGIVTELKSIDIWKLKATNQGFLKARKNPIWEPDEE